MTKIKKRILIPILFALALLSVPALHASSEYDKGDFTIGLRIPLNIPVFTYAQEADAEGNYSPKMYIYKEMGVKNIQAGLELDFGYFMTPNISIGGIFGYNFLYDRGDKLLSKIPLLFKANFYLYSKGRVDIPLSFAFGVNYMKYKSTIEHFTLQFNVEIGVNVFWDNSWGVIFRTGAWFYPELYADQHKNNISCFVPIVVGVTYRK